MYLATVFLFISIATVIGSETPFVGGDVTFVRPKRSITSFFLGKWCPWGNWSPCKKKDDPYLDTYNNEKKDETDYDGENCIIRGTRTRNRTCECPKPKVSFMSKCRNNDAKEIGHCTLPCERETVGTSIPSFYVFLIISVSCIVVVGFFTCLYSSLRICHRRHTTFCFRSRSLPVTQTDVEVHRAQGESEDDMEGPSIQLNTLNEDCPPNYDDIIAEDRLKERDYTPPPLYDSLYASQLVNADIQGTSSAINEDREDISVADSDKELSEANEENV